MVVAGCARVCDPNAARKDLLQDAKGPGHSETGVQVIGALDPLAKRALSTGAFPGETQARFLNVFRHAGTARTCKK